MHELPDCDVPPAVDLEEGPALLGADDVTQHGDPAGDRQVQITTGTK